MASSSSSGASKINVKRGRKKKINMNNHNAKSNVLEDIVHMEVDSVEDTNIDQQSILETNNLNKETNSSNEKPVEEDTLNTTDMPTGETDKQTDRNMSILSTVEMLGIGSESATQPLGSTEFPIDIELAADFEDIGGNSLCDIHGNTVFDVHADLGIDMSATSSDYEKAEIAVPIVQDVVVNEGHGASAVGLIRSELPVGSSEGGEIEGEEVREVHPGQRTTLHEESGQAQSDAGKTSSTKVEPVKRRRGRPRREAIAKVQESCAAEGGEIEGEDITEVEAGEKSTLDNETSHTEVQPVKRRPGRPRRKNTVKAQESCAAESGEIEGENITEVEAGERYIQPVKRRPGRPSRKDTMKVQESCAAEIEGEDITEVEAGERCTLDNETSHTEVQSVKRRSGRPRRKDTVEMHESGAVGEDVVEVEAGERCTLHEENGEEVTSVKRGRGRQKVDDPEEIPPSKLTTKELRAEVLKALPEAGESKFSQKATKKIRALLRDAKMLPCPREGCEKMYKNYHGYEYHVLRCGVSVELECQHCGQIYTSKAGLAYHVRHAHREQVEVKEHKKQVVSSKSKYSQRQRSQPDRYCVVGDLQSSDDSDAVSGGEDSSFEEDDRPCTKNKSWRKYMERLEPEPGVPEPSCTSSTTELTNMTEISAALKEKARIKCPKKCGRYFRHPVRFYHHVKKCTGVCRQKYRCTLCGRELQSIPGMKLHIVTDHRKKRHNSENGEESEFSAGEKIPRRTKRREKRSFEPTSLDFREKTKAWYEALCGEPVLTCWRPSLKHWKRLPASEAEHYLPVRKMSPVFKIEPAQKKEDSTEDTEFELPLFSSVPISPVGGLYSITFNVGGSVWAMDWAPVPVDQENCDQYLAIGCHRDPDENHLLSECYKEKGVLQIWRLPTLQNGKCPREQPEFCLGIVHDYGPLWDVRWCPSGTWESSTQVGELRRLGLLALACADGKVRIFSVPFPCSLVENIGGEVHEKSPEDLLFRATPHAVLSPGSLCRKYEEECGAAWAVSWQPISGHKRVIASYADGTVAIWNLTTDNRILKASTPDGLTECIFPTSHFQAHNSVIRSLAWCPSEPNYIATGGYDKIIKIWDLRHTSQPVMTYKKAWTYSLTWPLHWALLIYTIDVDMARLKGTRFFDYYASSRDDKAISHVSVCFVSHNATAWDNDYSSWINVVASADAAGVLSMNFLNEGFYQHKTRVKKPIYRTFVEPVVESGDTANISEKKDKFKITFKDIHPLNATKAEREFLSSDTAYVPPDQPTRAALHKVRWNPNLSSYFWLATAGKCGLVRLCYVNQLM